MKKDLVKYGDMYFQVFLGCLFFNIDKKVFIVFGFE